MKKTKVLVDKLLKELEKTPLIQASCDKVNISRNTFYRWMKEYPEFLEQVSRAISLGEGLVNDVALSNVLSGIKAKDPKYTMYWLNRKHPDFRQPFVHKIDADDFLQYKRMLNDKERTYQIESDARDLAKQHYGKKLEESKNRIIRFQEKWFKKKL